MRLTFPLKENDRKYPSLGLHTNFLYEIRSYLHDDIDQTIYLYKLELDTICINLLLSKFLKLYL